MYRIHSQTSALASGSYFHSLHTLAGNTALLVEKTNAHERDKYLHGTVIETNGCDLRERKIIRHTEHAVTKPIPILVGFINWTLAY
jgi:hypothetical protein